MASHFIDILDDDSNYTWKPFVGDVRSESDVVRNLRDVDTVVHFAALTYMPTSWDSPIAFMETNLGGTLNFLKNNSMFKRFIYISTVHVYGDQAKVPIEIDTVPLPQDPYSVSKFAAEKAVEAYKRRYGLNTLIIRPFNNFGPRQAHHFAIPTFCLQAARDRKIVVKGDTVREFIYVKDNVRAIKALLDNHSEGLVQVSSGYFEQMYNMALRIAKISGIGWDKVTLEASKRSWEMQKLYGSPTSLEEKIGKMEWTPIDKALRETYKFYKGQEK